MLVKTTRRFLKFFQFHTIYQQGGSVYCVPLGGACMKQPYAIGGKKSHVQNFLDGLLWYVFVLIAIKTHWTHRFWINLHLRSSGREIQGGNDQRRMQSFRFHLYVNYQLLIGTPGERIRVLLCRHIPCYVKRWIFRWHHPDGALVGVTKT